METIPAAGRAVTCFESGAARNGPLFLLCSGQEGGSTVFEEVLSRTDRPFRLAVFPVENWEEELSPWEAKRVFRGGPDFGSGADDTVRRLTEEVLPALREVLGAPDAPCHIVGYSLAGLFAVYALCRTDAFAGAVSCSGSLWFPGFPEFCRENAPIGRPEGVYFSLGDRESRTRNPVMAAVEENTAAVCRLFCERGYDAVFELNPGGHFQDPEKRLAKGIAWMLNRA